MTKPSWRGVLTSVQPRIRLTRSFDQRHHSYLGYVVRVDGVVDSEERELLVGIGEAAQAKHSFCVGDIVSGASHPVPDSRLEPGELYKTSALKLLDRPSTEHPEPPPWTGTPPTLETYRQRGHRRLDARTYKSKCQTCIWGCRMPVEIIIDQWNPSQRKYRFETFCYGPKSCAFYRAGRPRTVPGRKGMTWEEPDWIDEEATAHRDADE